MPESANAVVGTHTHTLGHLNHHGCHVTFPLPTAVLDGSYRRALALPADCVYPQFDLGKHIGVLAAVRQMLLSDAGLLTAELHALNIYPAGGFFKPHRDTPRADPGFVGSLVVCLPVGHSGGELVVEHGGQRVEFGWGEGAAAGEVQWAAFFSDCRHEVLPVATGARVTLTYDLFAHPGAERDCLQKVLATQSSPLIDTRCAVGCRCRGGSSRSVNCPAWRWQWWQAVALAAGSAGE